MHISSFLETEVSATRYQTKKHKEDEGFSPRAGTTVPLKNPMKQMENTSKLQLCPPTTARVAQSLLWRRTPRTLCWKEVRWWGIMVQHCGSSLAFRSRKTSSCRKMGQLEAPKGRKGEHYWPLKTFGESALESGANRANVSGEVKGIVSRPLSITFVGLRDMLRNGTLYE